MKKVVFMMSMLLTLGLFSACNNEGDVDNGMYINEDGDLVPIPIPEDGEVVKPIELPERHLWTEESDKVTKLCYFFNEGLPIGTRSNSFFVGSDKDECYVINNLNELKSIYCGDKEMPELDFNKYTLVIGQKVMPKVFYPVLSQELEFFDKKCELKLHVPALTAENKTDLPLYYWALYPKLKTEDISVKFVRERDAVITVKDVYCTTGKYNPFDRMNPDEWKWYFIPYWRAGEDLLFASAYYARIFPINLSDKVNVSELMLSDDLTFSGEVVKMTEDAITAIGAEGRNYYYFAYLNEIDVKEYVEEVPYRGTVPFIITDMPGFVGYDWHQQTYYIAYRMDYSKINPYFPNDYVVTRYYPTELSEEFKFDHHVETSPKVIISGNVYEDISTDRKIKTYRIELTKIEKAE